MKRYCYNCMKPLSSEKCLACGYTFKVPPTHHLMQGTVLNNRYLIGNAIGEGGFGITYIGRDLNLDMIVAVKEFYPKGFVNRNNLASNNVEVSGKTNSELFEKGRKKLIREARTLARFSGTKSIVDVRDYFENNNTGYIVMEYIRGETLKSRIERYGVFSPDELISKMMPLFYALEKLHDAGLIHRDISPDNIMLVDDGGIKLMDFGATRNVNFITDRTLSVMLKPGYAPDEQYRVRGVQGPWTDIYAICSTIYKCITGVTPDDSLERAFSDKLKAPSELDVEISDELEKVILKGMSPCREDRYQNMTEFINAVNSAIRSERDTLGEAYDDNDRTVYYTEDEPLTKDFKEPDNNELQLSPKNGRGRKRLFAALTFMIITVMITAFVFYERAGYTKIPKVYSLSESSARSTLKKSGLKYKFNYEYSDKLGKGKVITQKPSAGENVKKSTIVNVTVSKGKLVAVPNVIGSTEKKAKTLITDASLKLTVKNGVYSNSVRKGLVLNQNPNAASALAEGSTVSVVISKGKKPVAVPNLYGLTLRKAKEKAKRFKIKLKYEYSDSSEGTVIKQSLKAGDRVPENSKLTITVSKGAEPTEPPTETEYSAYYEQEYPTEAAESPTKAATEPQTLGELKFDDI